MQCACGAIIWAPGPPHHALFESVVEQSPNVFANKSGQCVVACLHPIGDGAGWLLCPFPYRQLHANNYLPSEGGHFVHRVCGV